MSEDYDALVAREKELEAKRDQLHAELLDIDERAGNGELSGGLQQRWNNTQRAATKVDLELRQVSRQLIEMRGDQVAELVRTGKAHVDGRNAPQVMRRAPAPWSSESRDSAFSRARQAVETNRYADDNARENAVRLLERADRSAEDAANLEGIERHLLDTSDPDYVSAFAKFTANPQHFGRMLNEREAAAMAKVDSWNARTALSLSAGSVLVPQHLDPTINLTNAGAMHHVREVARIEKTYTDQMDFVNSEGVTAEWLAEATEVADATPAVTGPTIPVHKRAAWLYGSHEFLMDSTFDGEVGRLISDAFYRQEASAFMNGTGSGQPYGLITRLSGTGPLVAGSSGAAGAADLVVADIYALDNALDARWNPNASWMAHHSTYNEIRQLNTDASGSTFWVDLGKGTPAELIGHPSYKASAMDSTIVSGSNDYVLLLGDFSQYVVVDRIGTQLMYEPLVKGAGFRPTGQAGWYAFSRVGADILTSNAFKLLKL